MADADVRGEWGLGGFGGHSLTPLGHKEPRPPRAGGSSARKKTQPFPKLQAKPSGVILILQLCESGPRTPTASRSRALSLTREPLPSESWRTSRAFHAAENKVKTPLPSPPEEAHSRVKRPELLGMLQAGPTLPPSQNYTLLTPSLV